MIPTSIDGTDITGATIDGSDVTEITVDGDTVFKVVTINLPVAYSNLVAWYPFDSATYGGANADDVTAILGGSGDDTAYNGTVTGATYQSSGGVTDISAGANSGAFDFDGSNDFITTGYNKDKDDFTYCAWANPDDLNGQIIDSFDGNSDYWASIDVNTADGGSSAFQTDVFGKAGVNGGNISTNVWFHVAGVRHSNGLMELYIDGSFEGSTNGNGGTIEHTNNERIGADANSGGSNFDGVIEDVRIYDTALSASQINQIYQNTEP